MPRSARVKGTDKIYHIMVKSIKEACLFVEKKDKDAYMAIIKGYQETYGFKVYGYCLMDNHGHFIIDANGADISNIMKSINHKYAVDYNKKYKRIGHLFYERFKSKIIESDRYLITLSAYIHNNVLDMKRFRQCPERYQYSSLGVYLGLKKDPFEILDESFIMRFFGEGSGRERENYMKFVYNCNDKEFKKEMEFVNEKTCYKSERHILVRDYTTENIFEFLEWKTGVLRDEMHIKSNRGTLTARAFAALIMRHLCNYRCSDICRILGNISQGRVSKLCSTALEIMHSDEKYRHVVMEFIEDFTA